MLVRDGEYKPIIAMDLSTKGSGGGPFTSTNRIINSKLKDYYDFQKIEYKVELGRGLSIKRIIDLVKQIKRINPDIVHFTGLQLSGLHMAIACKLAGVKNSLVTVRGFSGDSIEFSRSKRFILKYILEPFTLLLVKNVYGVSEFVSRRRIIRFFAWKSFGYIYNFPPHFQLEKTKMQCRNKFGFLDTDIVVVSVARINREKGYHILTEVIKELKQENSIRFLIAGDGDYLEQMKHELRDQIATRQVKFLGYQLEVDEVNVAGDIFVLPTLHETLSVALLEASQAKLALIASNTGGVPEIVQTDLNGILVPPGDAAALIAAIKRLSYDDDLRAKLGRQAYIRLREKFNHDKIAEQINNVYTQILRLN